MRVTWEEAGWEELGPRVGRCRLPGWDCTVGLVVGEGAALMIDAGSGLREGAWLRTEARRLLGGGRVTHLALTHPHFDHVFGAAAFSGVEVFGAVGLDRVLVDGRDELLADAVRNGADPGEATEAADLLVRPRHLVSGEWTLDLGGGIQVLLTNAGPGHTGHDLAVFVPASAGAFGGSGGLGGSGGPGGSDGPSGPGGSGGPGGPDSLHGFGGSGGSGGLHGFGGSGGPSGPSSPSSPGGPSGPSGPDSLHGFSGSGGPSSPGGSWTSSPEIVFCGDLVEESGEPQAGPDAVPSRWPAALDRLLALGGEDAVYVPGHGAAVDAGFVRAQRDALAQRFGVS
ncbi:MBL fold metallo-hydrolase [Streptomyces sp. NPDC058694]|uniref:MBL fold metallo-hydrolase n=1 Tax=Streptomyces sp. NPDC058694 TaxID=3346603 RepID=UPI00364D0FF9